MFPRFRVIVDNDFSTDPDDLFQLAHHLLSPSVDIPFVIASHSARGIGLEDGAEAGKATVSARRLIDLMGFETTVITGSEGWWPETDETAAARAIIAEARRDDSRPLYVAAGAGLTDLALALRLDPGIADLLTLVWIGGREHDPDAASIFPAPQNNEYNMSIDPAAAQYVFNETSVPIWQVPRDVYRACPVSVAELEVRLARAGELGAYLLDSLHGVSEHLDAMGLTMAESYHLGDSPLVALTALQSTLTPDATSGRSRLMPTPFLEVDGHYTPRHDGRPLRVFTSIDTRLMFEDLFAKLERFANTRA